MGKKSIFKNGAKTPKYPYGNNWNNCHWHPYTNNSKWLISLAVKFPGKKKTGRNLCKLGESRDFLIGHKHEWTTIKFWYTDFI